MPSLPQKSVFLIWPDLKDRLKAPCTSMTFYAHLLFGVIICGGAGVLLTFLKPGWRMEDLSAALLGYFPALAGAAVLEFTAEDQPYIRSLGLIALSFLIPVAFLSAKTQHGWQLFWSITGTVLGIFAWWTANGLNERFSSDVKAQSALGGDVARNLHVSEDQGWRK